MADVFMTGGDNARHDTVKIAHSARESGCRVTERARITGVSSIVGELVCGERKSRVRAHDINRWLSDLGNENTRLRRRKAII